MKLQNIKIPKEELSLLCQRWPSHERHIRDRVLAIAEVFYDSQR